MVLHRQALRLIVLVGLSSHDYDKTIENLCNKLNVKFPCDIDEFTKNEFLPSLTPEVESCFMTSDLLLTYDYRPFVIAARQLGLERFIGFDETGPTINLSVPLLRWRENNTARLFIEICILAGIPLSQIRTDMNRMFGGDIDETNLKSFELLFVDRTYLAGTDWFNYIKCVGDREAMEKRKLMDQPPDYVRWKLGVPVSLSSDLVLDRMISDAYYTERLLRQEAVDPLKLCKNELNRVKMERDTLFKCVDRRIKLKETDPKGGTANTDAAQEIKRIIVELSPNNFPTIDEVIGSENGN